jgi:phosphatidylglycerophosphatase A
MNARGVARLIASFFGCGYSPAAPGSIGSLVALLLGAGLMRLSPMALPLAALLAACLGVWAIGAAEAGDDPGWVVIDEVAGMWISLTPLARPTLSGLLAAFLLFRLLDITKPGPIGWADRQHSPAGVMADDLIAGAIAAGILWAAQTRWPGLFGGAVP